jgi:hypothetical protein
VTRTRQHEPINAVAGGVAPEVLGRFRVLHTAGNTVLASRGLDLFVSHDGARSFTHLAKAWEGPAQRALALTPLLARLMRNGIHAALPLPDGGQVAIVRGAVMHRAPDAHHFTVAHRVVRGTRPLGICLAEGGNLYFGEYFNNPGRDEVHVFRSVDGRQWEVAFTFPRGEVRHVHGVVYDRYRRGLWVLTGDDGDEAAIWWTSDDFRTLEPVIRGCQAARAVSALPAPQGLLVPSDTPSEPNFVHRLDSQTGRMERLVYVPGSVFAVGRTRSLFLVSTALERSSVNVDPRVALYASADGETWAPVARFERDFAFLDDKRGYLQYPMVLLPGGEQTNGSVLATGQALNRLHGRLLRWDESQLLAALHASAEVVGAQPDARLRAA